ncbi:hypothetical protein PybrP1_004393 [[Pythium] brassicae (nom. inval.)]|nr:hypothetical protein PybrP1_004393 [[Pythium] brassicae (nom. inval.)]
MAPSALPRKSQTSYAPKQGLDAKAEYLDVDGVPRRSETVTRRMIQRGLSIGKAQLLTDDDQLHTSRVGRQQETDARATKLERELAELKKKQDANAELKLQVKAERRQWIDDSYELVAMRLGLWYSNEFVPANDANVDVTEKNTQQAPSKNQRYIDELGNLRRKARPAPVPETPTSNAAADALLEPSEPKDSAAYVQVATPPVSPGPQQV